MTHSLVLQDIAPVTHDTWHLTFNRPADFAFVPGQATEIAFHKDGIRDEGRPFTMVSQPGDPALEFVIKSYPDHDGVTARLPDLAVGDRAHATDPFGAITDQGPGVFLAAGTGITPFIAILKKHAREGISGDTLLFSNRTDADIILHDTWQSLSGVTPYYFVTNQHDTAHRAGMIDTDALAERVTDTDQPCYICGPGGFVDAMRKGLRDIGVPKARIVTEDGW